jgi:hypothetical protein
MSAAPDQAFPTMIIPKGTEVRINNQGQLSIKTPGNLVIQNSGTYSELESTNGSIRIEENVHVEAVSVRAAQACFIQGTLTAWRVHAKKISLEDRARANIMLQESEQLELSKNSRLVGNFGSEKEIYLLLAKFSNQLKQLPSAIDMGSDSTATAVSQSPSAATLQPGESSASAELPDPLRQSLHILEQELRRPDLDAASAESIREISYALRENDQQRVSRIYRDAFAEVQNPSPAIRLAYDYLNRFFATF